MKLRFHFLLIAAIALGASSLTIIVIRLLDRSKEVEARQQIQTATTNMMQEMKPLTAPPVFPEKK